MAEELIISRGASRKQAYEELLPQIQSVIADESDLIANLANIAAMLREAFGFFWVGFYRMKESELVLGPFQGPLACTRIALDRGVCGAAATRKAPILVPDVDLFPGHIACSSLSRSEVVVPLVDANGDVQMVLDVDSEFVSHFSDTDVTYLGKIVDLLKIQHFTLTAN